MLGGSGATVANAAVAYYRVSTRKQEASGLGLEVQERAVKVYAARNDLAIVRTFMEIEAGTRQRERPELAAAIVAAKDKEAVLLIAKLDRLARNVHFVSGLMESGVKFTAVDMPQVDNLTIHILAAVEAYRPITGYVQLLYESGLGHEAIARRLNEEGHQTRRGKRFYAMTVYRILERVGTT